MKLCKNAAHHKIFDKSYWLYARDISVDVIKFVVFVVVVVVLDVVVVAENFHFYKYMLYRYILLY